MSSNILVSVVTTAILWERAPTAFLLSWLGLLFVVTAGRFVAVRHASRSGAAHQRPEGVLRLCTIGAFVTGLVWAMLPIVTDWVLGHQTSTLLLILIGLAAGAVTLCPAHWPTSIAFAGPILIATVIGRFDISDTTTFLFGAVAAFFTLMLARMARLAEYSFCEASRSKHSATVLAAALREANAESEAKAVMLEVMASQDSLTGLSNRDAFSRDLATLLAEPVGGQGSLLLLDLDHFKFINDTLGHGAGDGVLVEVAARLRSVLGDGSVAARLGGDEFAILVGDRRCPEEIAQRILDAVARPLVLGDRSTRIGASIGIACFPEDGQAAEDLMGRADLALYAAKSAGRQQFRRFDASLLHTVTMRRDLELDLARALSEGAIEVWCQPQLSLSDHSLVGVELLIRWNHERHGWIGPPDIVAAARSSHQSEALTLHVIRRACRLIQDLRSLGQEQVTVAVNISPQELCLYPLAERIAECLAAHDVPARSLEVEITEDATIAGDEAIAVINDVAALGVRIAIDDFGSGYSSLASLRTLRVERIKIDRGFVTDMNEHEGDRILVQAILGIGRALGVEVVAEGVEKPENALLLTRYGCHIAQGFHFARPMPRLAFDAWNEGARSSQPHLTVVGAIPHEHRSTLRRSS